jgi:hypothetical protein
MINQANHGDGGSSICAARVVAGGVYVLPARGAVLAVARLDRIIRRAHTLSQLLEDGYSIRRPTRSAPAI